MTSLQVVTIIRIISMADMGEPLFAYLIPLQIVDFLPEGGWWALIASRG